MPLPNLEVSRIKPECQKPEPGRWSVGTALKAEGVYECRGWACFTKESPLCKHVPNERWKETRNQGMNSRSPGHQKVGDTERHPPQKNQEATGGWVQKGLNLGAEELKPCTVPGR